MLWRTTLLLLRRSSREAARRPRARMSCAQLFSLAPPLSQPQPGGGNGGARAGTLRTRAGDTLPTPGILLATSRGLPPHLSPDLLADLRPAAPNALAVHVNPLHFLEHPSPEQVRAHGGGGALALLGLAAPHERTAVVCSPRDPAAFDAGVRQQGDGVASVHTPGGFRQLTPDRYVDVVSALRPDAWVALADDVPASASAKRTKQAVDRSLVWLDRCLEAASGARRDGQEGNETCGPVWGLVGGGASCPERARSAAATAKRPVAGFAVGGLGTGEDPAARRDLLKASLVRAGRLAARTNKGARSRRFSGLNYYTTLSLPPTQAELPAGLPRYVMGLALPVELLEAVCEGADLLDCPYPQLITAAGEGFDKFGVARSKTFSSFCTTPAPTPAHLIDYRLRARIFGGPE